MSVETEPNFLYTSMLSTHPLNDYLRNSPGVQFDSGRDPYKSIKLLYLYLSSSKQKDVPLSDVRIFLSRIYSFGKLDYRVKFYRGVLFDTCTPGMVAFLCIDSVKTCCRQTIPAKFGNQGFKLREVVVQLVIS